MRRNVAVGVVLLLLLALVVWWKFLRGGDDGTSGAGTTAAGSGSAITGSGTRGSKEAPATKVALSGRVTRKADGTGVAGAIVSIAQKRSIEAMFNRGRGLDEAPGPRDDRRRRPLDADRCRPQ